jgi:hypothetical protein
MVRRRARLGLRLAIERRERWTGGSDIDRLVVRQADVDAEEAQRITRG